MNIIIETLKKTDLNQGQLAEKLGMSEQTLSNKKKQTSDKLKLTEEQYEILRKIMIPK
tara:strand:- start:1509 stop:1682 length:174 start_codon:yes stop_codon:yes gene_type:complete